MSIPGARAKLKDSYRALMLAWAQAAEHWDDPVSRALQERHLEPLETTIRSALNAMDTMNETLERLRRDCQEEVL
ncbi:MAG: hypothetical protein U0636_10310 [Phycisphaerales bacterium]